MKSNLTYKLTDETIVADNGETLYRIEAVKDIPSKGVKVGDKGGFVSSLFLDNGKPRISGDAWVYDNARVYGYARVYDNARVYGYAHVDSVSAIINLIIPGNYYITVTRKHVQIGCQLIERRKALKITKKQAKKLGLHKKHYDAYKLMIQGAFKLVKEKR